MKNILLAILIWMFSLAICASETQFVEQVLEPLGGRIDRPSTWYYSEGHTSQSWVWTISREKSEGAPYKVGLRIQAALNVQKITGKSAKQFILEFKANKIQTADKVISDCDESDIGLFTRVCVETEEGDFHIIYSLFWGNNMDLIVISTYGAPKEEWSQYESIFKQMDSFELIDMNRYVQ